MNIIKKRKKKQRMIIKFKGSNWNRNFKKTNSQRYRTAFTMSGMTFVCSRKIFKKKNYLKNIISSCRKIMITLSFLYLKIYFFFLQILRINNKMRKQRNLIIGCVSKLKICSKIYNNRPRISSFHFHFIYLRTYTEFWMKYKIIIKYI